MGQKRGRDLKPQVQEPKKRKKGSKSGSITDDDWDGVVGLDDLNWKEVALPDRMEDAGGFFGLEEIDGVDVVRPQGNGEVQFKVHTVLDALVSKALLTTVGAFNRQRQANRGNP